jgi:hypothetical protein
LEISSSKLSFRLSLVDIDALKPHEEVIETSVDLLSREIQKEGLVRDPLLVDQEDNVILDGMHRFSSLKTLKCRFAPTCLLDYDNPQIKVGSWSRLFTVDNPAAFATKLLSEAGLDFSTSRTSLKKTSYNPHTIIMTADGTEYFLSEKLDLLEQTQTAVRLEKTLTSRGHAVDYQSEMTATEHLRTGPTNFIICLPIFTRQQIRECGLQNRLLPHKATRHVIPSRPLRVDVPLELLKRSSLTVEEANRELGELLATRRVERKPPGSVVDGRRYQEELLLFS